MIGFIRRAFDAVRLTRELETAEAEIARLKSQLGSRITGPRFEEMAKDIDAERLFDRALERVVEELGPVIERDLVMHLKEVESSLRGQNNGRPLMLGSVAAHRDVPGLYTFDLRLREAHCRVEVYA